MTFALESAMILYDWKSVVRAAGGSAKRVILALRVLTGEVPRNHRDPLYRYYIKDLTGKSFLLNPHGLLENTYFYTPKEIAHYLGIASFRNLSYYQTTGDTSLDLFHVPVKHDIITNNRLLSIENGRVRFKYEEVTEENT